MTSSAFEPDPPAAAEETSRTPPGKPAGAAGDDGFPERGALLGLDYGSRRIGAAISTAEQTIASPLDNYTRQTRELDERWLCRLVDDWGPVGLVVGLPVHMSGDEGEKAREARRFGEWAARATGLPLRFADERFSTLAAELRLMETGLSPKKQKARRDKMAAQILLQTYLDAPDRTAPPADLRADAGSDSTSRGDSAQ